MPLLVDSDLNASCILGFVFFIQCVGLICIYDCLTVSTRDISWFKTVKNGNPAKVSVPWLLPVKSGYLWDKSERTSS